MSGRIWLDVYDAPGVKLGPGPVDAREIEVTRRLDRAGSWRARCIASDPRALSLLREHRMVTLWMQGRAGKRRLGEGIITGREIAEDPHGHTLIVEGTDLMEELRRKNTLLGRAWSQRTVASVVADLIALVPGWSADVEESLRDRLVDVRFDGVNVLKALITIAHRHGFHLRTSALHSRLVELGPFEEDSGLRVIGRRSQLPDEPDDLPLVDRIERQVSSAAGEDWFNVLFPMGSGEGEAALTLARATRSEPYPIQEIEGPDGRTLYYLATKTWPTDGYEDFNSDPQAVIKFGQYKDIAPLSNSQADLRNAANALYDEAAEALKRGSVIQEVYDLQLLNVQRTLVPGDCLHVNYKSGMETDAGLVNWLDVYGDYCTLEVSESVNVDGHRVKVQVSNLDRPAPDAVSMIVQNIEQMQLRQLKPNIVQGAPTAYVYAREIAPGFEARVPIEITGTTLELNRIRLRLKTGPFRSTVSGEIEGVHHHLIAQYRTTAPSPAPTSRPYQGSYVERDGSGGGTLGMNLETSTLKDFWTSTVGADITFDQTFEISDDDQFPTGISVQFGGEDITELLFGVSQLEPYANTATGINVVTTSGELADLLTAAGLQGDHELEIRCAGGQGRIEVTVERWETTQSIRVID